MTMNHLAQAGDASPMAALSHLAMRMETDPGGAEIHEVLQSVRKGMSGMDRDTRIAVVGQIKRGKSTLVNALLGARVAATGQLELTFNINEFVYPQHTGPEQTTIHYRPASARPLTTISRASLGKLTAREPDTLDVLRDVDRIVFEVRNDLLQKTCLVDTPGLGSVYGTDSINTLTYLGVALSEDDANILRLLERDSKQIGADSEREIGTADAVLFLFSRGRLHTRDRDVVMQFLGGEGFSGRLNPLRAFGVLSSCDLAWSRALRDGVEPAKFDPLAHDAQPQIERFLRQEPEVRQIFHTIIPVAGLVAEGARTLSSTHFEALRELAGVEPDRLVMWLRDIGEFTRPDLIGCPISAAMTVELAKRLGAWGIYLACLALRDDATEDEVRARLLERSGVLKLEEQIRSHFGNRSYLIKLEKALMSIEAKARERIRKQNLLRAAYPKLLDEVMGVVESIRENEHGFAELAVLRDLYYGRLMLDDDGKHELTQVTGELGAALATRLGHDETASAAQLRSTAATAMERWSRRAIDPALNNATQRAAGVIRRSYAEILLRLSESEGSV